MEGALFYWFAWIGWTIFTFFIAKSNHRIFLSAMLLAMIYCSLMTLRIEEYQINGAILMLIVISYTYMGTQKVRTLSYSVFVSILISLCYLGVHFIVVYDPVWVILDVRVFIAIPISLITLFMAKNIKVRLPILISGFVHGEIGYVIFFKDLAPGYTVGSYLFLDIISLSCMVVFLWSMYESFASTLKVRMDKPVRHVKQNAH